jgi:hypothetical protein
LTQAIEVGTKRVVCEMLLPQTGSEEMDIKGGMRVDTLEDIDQVDIGVDTLQAARGDQALHDAHILRPDFSPAKQPVASAQGNRANLAL